MNYVNCLGYLLRVCIYFASKHAAFSSALDFLVPFSIVQVNKGKWRHLQFYCTSYIIEIGNSHKNGMFHYTV